MTSFTNRKARDFGWPLERSTNRNLPRLTTVCKQDVEWFPEPEPLFDVVEIVHGARPPAVRPNQLKRFGEFTPLCLPVRLWTQHQARSLRIAHRGG